MVSGRKVWQRQVRGDGGLLQHGALLLEDDQRMVHQLAGSEILRLGSALSALLGRQVEFAEAAAAIRDAAAEWSDTWEPIDQRAVEAGAEAYQALFRSDALDLGTLILPASRGTSYL